MKQESAPVGAFGFALLLLGIAVVVIAWGTDKHIAELRQQIRELQKTLLAENADG